jgi:hypothetical protein
MEGGERLVTLATVWTQSELHCLKTLLTTNGVWTSVVGDRHAYIEPALVVALNGMRVQIRADDLAVAVPLIAGVDRTPYAGPIFSRNPLVNALAVALMIIAFCPAPARIPAHFHFAMRRDAEPV